MVKALTMATADNVATAVTNIEAGELVTIGEIVVKVQERIPFGHKFALTNIPRGGDVLKYGEVIGEASQTIEQGQHVHVHNVVSRRGRGDLIGEVKQ